MSGESDSSRLAPDAYCLSFALRCFVGLGSLAGDLSAGAGSDVVGAMRDTNSSDTRWTEDVNQTGWLNTTATVASPAAIFMIIAALEFFRVRRLVALDVP